MRPYDPKEPLIFIHVPKTAGTAVRTIVESWFPRNFYRHYFDEKKGAISEILSEKLLWESDVPPIIFGHFNKVRGFGVEDHYPGISQFVTILRDPFEATVSRYFFMRKRKKVNEDITLEKYLQTSSPGMLNHFPRETNEDNYKDVMDECFIEIGITEALPQSLGLIAGKLGKSFDQGTLPMVNVTKRDQAVPDTCRHEFMEKFSLEFSIYERAKARITSHPK